VILALETDIFSMLVQGHARVTARYAEVIAAGEDEVTIPIIVRIEALRGRFAAILTAADRVGLMAAADFLERTERALSAYRVLPLTYHAGERFDRLKANKKLKKIGQADLLIACIALADDATLVTRNVKDFAPITGLKVENWAD
jgi:tRNA(fMet)-specific endonuclease VapC